MAWGTAHFAVGMACGGAATGLFCLFRRSAWRVIPVAMTIGGVWALLPDMPRVFRYDYPNAPFASLLGHRKLETWLQAMGDFFCFHRALDAQPKEYALHGMTAILVMYNLSLLAYLWDIYRRGRRIESLEKHLVAQRLIRRAARASRGASQVAANTHAAAPPVPAPHLAAPVDPTPSLTAPDPQTDDDSADIPERGPFPIADVLDPPPLRLTRP